MTQMNIATKQKQTHRYREQTWLPRGKGGEGGKDRRFRVNRCKLVYTEWISNKALLNSTGKYIQSPVINSNGKVYEKECVYVCVCVCV